MSGVEPEVHRRSVASDHGSTLFPRDEHRCRSVEPATEGDTDFQRLEALASGPVGRRRLYVQVVRETTDLEQAGDDRRRFGNHESATRLFGVLVCLDDDSKTARVDELDLGHVHDDVARSLSDRSQLSAQNFDGRGIDFADN